MKKLQLIFLCILMMALCGCSKKEEPGEIQENLAEGKTISVHGSNSVPDGYDESYDQWYNTILDSNYELIIGGADNYEHREGTSGIGEVIMNSEESKADAIGYTFLDVNHDGVAELIIGSVDGEKEGKYYSENIYAVYTYQDIPYLLLEGWSRNRCFLLEDGTFYVEGCGGAMYSVLENYVLNENETVLSYKDFYFTKEKDESYEEIGFYHNTTGEMEVSVSEELDEDTFWNKSTEYSNRIISFELLPFSMYQYVEEIEGAAKEAKNNKVNTMQVMIADNYLDEWSQSETGVWDESVIRLCSASWQSVALGEESKEKYPKLAERLEEINEEKNIIFHNFIEKMHL